MGPQTASLVCSNRKSLSTFIYVPDKANQQLQSQINIAIEYGMYGPISGANDIIVLIVLN